MNRCGFIAQITVWSRPELRIRQHAMAGF